MSAVAVTMAGRVAAEALMVDQCTITRSGEPVTDPDTGEVTDTPTEVYAGKCKVQQQAVQSRPQTPGEAAVQMVRREVHLPVATSGGIRVGDLITITACQLDPDLVGRRLRVRDEHAKTYATARRLGVEEVTG